ncbi:MAG TPA: hypothetical protein PK530_16550 [Anaerolineales bacterium]|nr:hypothetical protein [Anaerolineales bacterium]
MLPLGFLPFWGAFSIWTGLNLISLLYGIPSLIQPGWWQEWFNATPPILTYAEHASSLFGLGALLPIPSIQTFLGVSLLAGLSFLFLKPYKSSTYWNWVAIFSPVANIYSLCLVIAQVDWVAILLSWVLLPLSLFLHTGLPWVIIPIYLWWRNKQQAKSKLMVSNF